MCACVEHGNQRVMTFNGVEKKKRPFFFLFFHECSSISLRFLFFSPIFLSPPFRPFWWTGTTRRNDSSTTDSLPPSYSNQEHNHHRYFLVAITWPSAFKLWVHSSRHRQPLPFKLFFFSDEIDDVTVSCGACSPFFIFSYPIMYGVFIFFFCPVTWLMAAVVWLLLPLSVSLRFCLYSWSHFPFDGQAHCPHTRCKHQRTRGRHHFSLELNVASARRLTWSIIGLVGAESTATINVLMSTAISLSLLAVKCARARECCAPLLTFRNETKIVVWPTRKVKLGGQSHFNFISFKCSPYGACCCYTASNERPSLLKRECKKKKLKGKELT